MRKIQMLDTTLRDGEQAPGYGMNLEDKLGMVRQLERLGVDIIEPGFAVSSQEDFEVVQKASELVEHAIISGFCRCIKSDIERTWQAICMAKHPRLHLFFATSDIHLNYKLNLTRDEAEKRIREAVTFAKSLCDEVQFSAEDATRSDREFLAKIFGIAEQAGASILNVADTVGFITPDEMYDLVCFLRKQLKNPNTRLAVHVHNDLGMGVANTLAAVRAGVSQVESTINGIGERAGNVALEEVVMALHTRQDYYHCKTNINTRQIYRTSKLLSTITGIAVPPNKPIVGANAFAHESGIHQHGILASPLTYEIMRPADIGIYQNKMVLGRHSGKHAFADRIAELGYKMSEEDISIAFEKFKGLSERKKEISDKDVEALIGAFAVTSVKETYTLKSFVINSGTIISATAVVRLVRDGEEIEHVARGEGPIDAAFKAIDRIVKMQNKLENWTIQAVTEGEDALGEAVSKITCNGHPVTGRGLSPDILEASIRSYLNAINKAIALENITPIE